MFHHFCGEQGPSAVKKKNVKQLIGITETSAGFDEKLLGIVLQKNLKAWSFFPFFH